MDWQPIETAPKDIPVLISRPGVAPVSAINASAYGARQWHTSADLFECFYPQIQFEPTHWQSLPVAPHDS